MIDSTEATATVPATGRVSRRFLARTFSAARWSEYDMLLRFAIDHEWVPMDLEQWIAAGGIPGRILILRHDVDQHPAMAVRMAAIEARLGLRGTWYFRWRTASRGAIDRIRALGGGIGFHYETLTRLALERGLGPDRIDDAVVQSARRRLAGETAAFARHVGEITSICAHGDTRVPGVSNQVLVRGQDPAQFGVAFDANEAISAFDLGLWMTDRAATDGGWKDGIDPLPVLRDTDDPVLCLTHPNNWCSGASLWRDRLTAATRWPLGTHTRTDRPLDRTGPVRAGATPDAPPPSPPPAAARAAVSLRREILRHQYDHRTRAEGLVEAHARLLESRAALDRVLARAQLSSARNASILVVRAGFGTLALALALRGARVTAIEPDAGQLAVGREVAREHGLSIEWRAGADQLEPGHYDVALVDRGSVGGERRAVLAAIDPALRPGAVAVVLDPYPAQPTWRRRLRSPR